MTTPPDDERFAGFTPGPWRYAEAATSAIAGDTEKAKHHTISTASALANWHAQLSGASNVMRPGIAPPEQALQQEGRES